MPSLKTPRLSGIHHRNVVVLADPKQEIGKMIREILRSLSVQNVFVSDDLPEIVRRIENFSFDMIVINDSPKNPVPLVLRELIKHPICTITPVIVLADEASKLEADFMANLGRPMIVSKPLSPGRFGDGYKALTKVWGSGYFLEINKAIQAFKTNDNNKGMQILIALSGNSASQAVVTPCLAGLLRRDNNAKVAEKILLATLKNAPRDAGVVLSLCDLYLHSSMPSTAQRLLKSLENSYGTPASTALDRLQAHLMLNEIEPAIIIVKELIERDLRKEQFEETLIKMLYTEGRLDEATMTKKSETRVRNLVNAWNPQATSAPKEAS